MFGSNSVPILLKNQTEPNWDIDVAVELQTTFLSPEYPFSQHFPQKILTSFLVGVSFKKDPRAVIKFNKSNPNGAATI